MDSNAWARKVEEAPTAEKVIELLRDYLATRDPDEMRLLPPVCAPPSDLGRADIADFAYRLAAYHSHDESARLVQRISGVVSRAAVRLAELDRRPGERQPG